MIYTDKVHLIADSLAELHEFARLIGLKACWFHNKPNRPHYDLMKGRNNRMRMIKEALKHGAILCTSRDIIRILQGDWLTKEMLKLDRQLAQDAEKSIWGIL